MADFTFNGDKYTVDDTSGRIAKVGTDGMIYPVSTQDQANVALNAAAQQAIATAAGNTTPTATTPSDTNEFGQRGEPSISGVGTAGTSAAPPPAATPPAAAPAPAIPATPPRLGVGSDTENRNTRAALQKQLDDLQKGIDPKDGPTNAQATTINALNTRITSLSEQISKNEAAKDKPASTMRGTGAKDEPFIIVDNGDGTITPTQNPNYTGQITPQIVSHGNHTFVVTPPTKEELAADPAAKPHTTVAYTDTDAQQLANRQTSVAEANSKVAAAQAATNDYATRARVELEQRVSKGEDAASVRAEQAQKLTELHQAWVEADGDRRAKQTELDSYNTERHNTARDELGLQQVNATATAQAAQDATIRRGQDISAETSKYGTDTAAQTSRYATNASMYTAKLQAAQGFFQNALSSLDKINAALPPGSDLAGRALEGLLSYGAKFFQDFAGPQPTAPGGAPAMPGAPPPPAGLPPIPQPAAPTPVVLPPVATSDLPSPTSSMPWQNPRPPETAASSALRFGPITDQGVEQYAAANNMDWNAARAAMEAAQPGAPAPGAVDTGAQMAAANAASHQQNMAARLSPDGTPYASPADVARIFGRGGTA